MILPLALVETRSSRGFPPRWIVPVSREYLSWFVLWRKIVPKNSRRSPDTTESILSWNFTGNFASTAFFPRTLSNAYDAYDSAAACYVTVEVATTSYFIKIRVAEEWVLQVCELGERRKVGFRVASWAEFVDIADRMLNECLQLRILEEL